MTPKGTVYDIPVADPGNPQSRWPFTHNPKGWYMVAYSDDVAVGETKALKYFGRDLVLFRGEDGEARMLDAFCPHLGAHLGFGGKVEGNEIRCPFHAWKFNGEGTCTEVPYAKKIPPLAKIGQWHLQEINGLIMAWINEEGGEPEWENPRIDAFYSDEWTDYERREWTIKTHNIEMGENQVDTAHFHYLHGTATFPESTCEIDGPYMKVLSDAGMTTPRGDVMGQIESNSWGFGLSVVYFRGIVDTALVSSSTPIDGERVHTRFNFLVKKMGGADVTKGVGKAFIREVSKQLEEDMPIWENKVYVKPPILCEGDGPIGIYRKWCKQFFPEGTFETAR